MSETNELIDPVPLSTKGHFSAKLLTKNTDGSETWSDYDTRTDSEPAINQCILVFNSGTGLYEKAKDLNHAKELFAYHSNRILNPVTRHDIKETNFNYPNREINSVINDNSFRNPIRELNTINKVPVKSKIIVL